MTHETPQEKGQRLIAELNKSPGECDTALCLRLIANGVAPNAQDNDGYTALMRTAWRGHTAIARTLLENGAAVDTQTKHGENALTLAAWYGYTNITHALLEKGADTGLRTEGNKTAWELAKEMDHHDLAKVIHDHHIRKTFTAAAKKGTKQPRKIIRRKMRAAP
ncbi:MAG: ankyrin repeat domain-containing protein [Alphaproteobacteria bacterium]|nr:ankyrin repeat domain-containing protein [Alphaproteobacteria bacterium]